MRRERVKLRIEPTDYVKEFVSVDFEEGPILVNLNLTLPDAVQVKKVAEEIIEYLTEQLAKKAEATK